MFKNDLTRSACRPQGGSDDMVFNWEACLLTDQKGALSL